MSPRGAVEPLAPLAVDLRLLWDASVPDAVAAVAAARSTCGDALLAESGWNALPLRLLPPWGKSFYALPEDQPSKGVADYLLLRRKLPDEAFLERTIDG